MADSEIIKRAIDGAYQFCEQQQMALDQGHISEEQWFNNHKTFFTTHYLASDNPRGQSGHSGDEIRYKYTQEMILEAITEEGSFLDVGCANGHLLEKLNDWCSTNGKKLDFFGLDISEDLISLAIKRLPHWAKQFYIGNALYWIPPRRYRYVCVKELDYVPTARRQKFFQRLYTQYVQKDGRLILGPWTEYTNNPTLKVETTAWGYPPTGEYAKPHQDHQELIRRIYWYDVT